MHQHEKINYVEFPSTDMETTKAFFAQVFGWEFEDFGTEYTAFYSPQSGLDGGFFKSDKVALTDTGSALVIFYSEDIESSQLKVRKAGGEIIRDIFSFPGGRRFHFTEPSGNEFAIWSDK